MLLLVQYLALGHDDFVLSAGLVVSDKGVNTLADDAHVGLRKDGVTQFAGLCEYDVFFGFSQHSDVSLRRIVCDRVRDVDIKTHESWQGKRQMGAQQVGNKVSADGSRRAGR